MKNNEKHNFSEKLNELQSILDGERSSRERAENEQKRLRRKIEALEESLAEQNEIIEEARRIKNRFLSTMSHELRTPLNSIISLSRILKLKSGNRLADEEKQYLEIINRNGEQLLTLINDILDLARIETGRVELNFRYLKLQSILSALIESYERKTASKGIGLYLRTDENLPDIYSDEQRLHQIFNNLIDNAVKFTDKGSVTVSVTYNLNSVFIKIEDTGIGIKPEQIAYIFDDFKQIDSSESRKYEGTGLGLSIARKSARILRGDIHLSTTPGKGSIFTVELPFKLDRVDDLPVEPSSEMTEKEKPLILVIDDDNDSIVSLSAILRDFSHIEKSYDGLDGLERAFELKPAVIILDMALPRMNGFMVAERLKADGRTADIPVLAVTALSLPEDRERILNSGCDDYIPKPYDIDYMINRVKYWLERS